jgi:mono/diheme cytochrome c family protein
MGDLWLGVTDASGNPALDEAGTPRIGRLTDCADCHAARASDGYLFGVAAAVRPKVVTPTPNPPPVPPLPTPPPPTPQPVCGDFVCNGAESCEVCSADCGRCHGPGDDDGGKGGGKG